MRVEAFEEHEDGSATMVVEMTDEEKRILLESALHIGLIEGMKMLAAKKLKEFNESNTDTSDPA